MVRTPCCDKNGLKKGSWTQEEDKKLIAYVTRYGHWNWRLLPKYAGLARCGKSCRLRWLNYLRPDVKRGNFSDEEEETIVRLHGKLGNRWSTIAAELPGRTDNEIKNHWHTVLKKRFQQNSIGKEAVISESSETLSENYSDLNTTSDTSGSASAAAATATNDESYDGLSGLDAYTEPLSVDFWTEPYLVDNSYVPPESEPVYFSPMYEVEIWNQNELFLQECEGLFQW
ncbi:hypothetical protein LR48_Vigan05g154800 [Vigna angularis]|uniref:Uncharacterized protein n=2 Tax=Phaseolus angularis TaxID=3914 RepID=A0A0L9UMJ4_PHAAN|nr:transcription factor MYB14 [Vigna angularis]KOM43943.1 hypothetical protein LR48_Vigan05g154800 [Vigna angularis]BAT92228.1 hypothetical protein VIGAN_07090900 [Vigna angularis var. angularis]